MHVEGRQLENKRAQDNLERNIAKEKGLIGEYYEREDSKSRLEDPNC